MCFAFGHLIGGWTGGKIYEFFSRKKIGRFAWLLLLFGAILPDIDYLFDWTIANEIHRTFTHSLFFLITIPLLVYLSLTLMKENRRNRKIWALFLFMGLAVHLFLDVIRAPGIPLLWPDLLHISLTSAQYLDPAAMSLLSSPAPLLRQSMRWAIFDMGLGVLWIFYLWWRRKVRF